LEVEGPPGSAARYPAAERGSEEVICEDENVALNSAWVKGQPGGFDSPKPGPSPIQSGVGPPLPWERDGGEAALVPGDAADEGWAVSPKGEAPPLGDRASASPQQQQSEARSPAEGVRSPESNGDQDEEADDELKEMLVLLEQHRPLLKLLKGEDPDGASPEGNATPASPDNRDRASIIEELRSLSGLLNSQIKEIEKQEGGQQRAPKKAGGMPSLDLQANSP